MIWTPECTKNLEIIKSDIKNSRGLSIPEFNKCQSLFCDRSDKANSSVLMHHPKNQPKKLELVSFDSGKMTAAETSTSIVYREIMAIAFGLKNYSWFLSWTPFQLFTDSQAALWLIKSKKTE